MQVTVELPIKVEDVIANFPKDLQEFLKTNVILAITSKTDENIFKLENNFEVRVKSVVQQSRHKTLVTIKQGKKQIFKKHNLMEYTDDQKIGIRKDVMEQHSY